MTIEACVDETCSGVNHQTEATKRALAFHSGYQIAGDTHALQGGTKHKLTGVQHEWLTVFDLHQFSEFGQVLLDVEDGGRVISKDTKKVGHLYVDAAGLHAGFVKWLDDDAVGSYLGAKVTVGKNHG